MTSRESILAAVRANQPSAVPLPDLTRFKGTSPDIVREYTDTFTGIGGKAIAVTDINTASEIIAREYENSGRIITTIPGLANRFEMFSREVDPHSFENVELAVVGAHLAVAENGAVWVTEEVMGQRIIPFICQHLAVVVNASDIVPTLHEAYRRIGTGDYGFGVFIGGPSKTADIEQALVLGAHGPISMTVFIITSEATRLS